MEIKLVKDKTYPVFEIGCENTLVALDSCSCYPVWVSGVGLLQESFDSVTKLDRCATLLGGFGGKFSKHVDVYLVSKLPIIEDYLEFRNVPVAIGEIGDSCSFSLILPLLSLFDSIVSFSLVNGQFDSLECTVTSDSHVFECEPNGTYVIQSDEFYMNKIVLKSAKSNWSKWLKYREAIQAYPNLDTNKLHDLQVALKNGTQKF